MNDKQKSPASAEARSKARANAQQNAQSADEPGYNKTVKNLVLEMAGYYRNPIAGGVSIVTVKKPSWLKRALVRWLLDLEWYEKK